MGEVSVLSRPKHQAPQSFDDIIHLDFQTESFWLNADDIPGIATARNQAALEAQTIMDRRMQHLRDGAYDLVPLDVDPLTTASRVLAAEKQYGSSSKEYAEQFASLTTDCERLFAEASRYGAWEYFPALAQPYDSAVSSYTFMGRSLTEMVEEGITPAAHPEERQNRIGEYVEEKTYIAVRALGAMALGAEIDAIPTGTEKTGRAVYVNTISECPDWAIRAYESGERNELGGNAPHIKKLMIRGVRIEKGVRYQEQMALSGEYITHEVVVETMRRMGVIDAESQPTKTEVRQTQMINLNGEGVLDLTKKLDEVASELNGYTIFRGERVADDHSRDYAATPMEAATRQKQYKDDSVALAAKLIELEKNGIDHSVANGIVRTFVTQLLLEKAKEDPEQAEIMFDTKTADGMREYQVLKASGDPYAEQFLSEVAGAAPSAGFCGAGSCGLEGKSTASEEGSKAVELGLKASNGEVIRDKERACPGCKKKTVYYDLIGSKVCVSCYKKDLKPQ